MKCFSMLYSLFYTYSIPNNVRLKCLLGSLCHATVAGKPTTILSCLVYLNISFCVRNYSIEFFLFQPTKFYPIPTSAEPTTEPEVPVTTPELDPETSTSTSTTCSSSSRMTSSATWRATLPTTSRATSSHTSTRTRTTRGWTSTSTAFSRWFFKQPEQAEAI